MAWLDEAYAYRAAITVYVTLDTDDPVLTIPKGWDQFWSAVRSDGYDVRFATADGITPIDFERLTWNVSTETATFHIESQANWDGGVPTIVWMYWGNANATDASQTLSLTPAGTAIAYLGGPGRVVVDMVADAPGATQPAVEVAKTEDDTIVVWAKVDRADISTARVPINGKTQLDEPWQMWTYLYASDGSTPSVAFSVTVANTRIFEDANGAVWFGIPVAGGTTGEDYILALSCEIWLYDFAVAKPLNKRITIKVRDLSAT